MAISGLILLILGVAELGPMSPPALAPFLSPLAAGSAIAGGLLLLLLGFCRAR